MDTEILKDHINFSDHLPDKRLVKRGSTFGIYY